MFLFSHVRFLLFVQASLVSTTAGFDCSFPGSRDYRGEFLRVTSCGAQLVVFTLATFDMKPETVFCVVFFSVWGLRIPHLFYIHWHEGFFTLIFWDWVGPWYLINVENICYLSSLVYMLRGIMLRFLRFTIPETPTGGWSCHFFGFNLGWGPDFPSANMSSHWLWVPSRIKNVFFCFSGSRQIKTWRMKIWGYWITFRLPRNPICNICFGFFGGQD